MYPPLLQLRIVPSIISTDDVFYDTNTTEHAVDAVLRSLTTGTVTTIDTTTTVIVVAAATVAVVGVSGLAGTAIAKCY